MNPDRPLRVVTHRSWLAEDFAAVGGVQDFGMDIDPRTVTASYWWAPGHWVARAAAAGVRIPVLSCGQTWLVRLSEADPDLLGKRHVSVVRAADAHNTMQDMGLASAHVKLPEMKRDNFEAIPRSLSQVQGCVDSGTLHPDTLVQISETMCGENGPPEEARLFLAHGKVVAHAWYRLGKRWIGQPGFDPRQASPNRLDKMIEAAQSIPEHLQPPGFVVDMGTWRHRPVVIEANAAWSSNPYGADPEGVFQALTAAHDFDDAYPQWAFDTSQYGPVPPLRLR